MRLPLPCFFFIVSLLCMLRLFPLLLLISLPLFSFSLFWEHNEFLAPHSLAFLVFPSSFFLFSSTSSLFPFSAACSRRAQQQWCGTGGTGPLAVRCHILFNTDTLRRRSAASQLRPCGGGGGEGCGDVVGGVGNSSDRGGDGSYCCIPVMGVCDSGGG